MPKYYCGGLLCYALDNRIYFSSSVAKGAKHRLSKRHPRPTFDTDINGFHSTFSPLDYCDIFLTHDSSSVRKAHNAGRNHLINVKTYYSGTILVTTYTHTDQWRYVCWNKGLTTRILSISFIELSPETTQAVMDTVARAYAEGGAGMGKKSC